VVYFGATFTITSPPASGSLELTRQIGFNVTSPTSPNLQIDNTSPLPDVQLNSQSIHRRWYGNEKRIFVPSAVFFALK